MSADGMIYAQTEPYKSGIMSTDDGHDIYWEACGCPGGVPIVFLHGGPGSGCSPWQRQLFDPEKYNAVFFDQRGSGRSKPHASLENNTTQHLIADIEQLRQLLGIQKWAVFGGSWGSTLALAYTDAYADKLSALVLYGIFLARDEELRHLYFEGGAASQMFPDVFEPYINMLPPEDRANPLKGYKKLFLSGDKEKAYAALDAWTRLEKRVVDLVVPPEKLAQDMSDPEWVLAHSLIENHYFLANGFIDGDALLVSLVGKLKDIPVHIVQGRYDMVCPFKTAWDLHQTVPHSVLHEIPDAGHTARNSKTLKCLTEILDSLPENLAYAA